jgi:CAAX protease family protein
MSEVPAFPMNITIKAKRPRWGPWATLAWGAGAALMMILTQTLGAVVYLLWQHATHPEAPLKVDQLASNGPALTTAFLVSAPFLLGFVVFAASLSRQGIVEYLGLRWPSGKHAGIGVAALAVVLLASGVAADALGQESPAFTTDTFSSAEAAGGLPLYFFAFVVLAPVQEEILFRGFLYRGLSPSIGPTAAIVLLSGAWAIFHVQYAWFFVGEIFVLGLTFGWLRWRSGSTLLTIMLHATVNGLAMLVAAFMEYLT